MTVANNIRIFQEQAIAFLNLEVEKIASGFQFTEGPLWYNESLLFSDVPANKIYRLQPGERVSVFLEKSGFSGEDISQLSDMIGSNALALDKEGMIVLCQHGDHAISRLDIESKTTYILTDNYNGRLYNSPNDLVIKSDESIYFTDPPYGLKGQVLDPEVFQDRAGVYRHHKGTTTLLCSDLRYPNGICFSPDERFLYVGSNHPEEALLYRYSVSPNGDITDRQVLLRQNADGIKTDMEGRLYLATDDGVLILSPRGERLALISIPESPSNLAWGGGNHRELFITARSSIYRISNFQ
jgi:gluconolactonase